MLPHARESLVEGGYSPRVAAWILLACFAAGVVGILLLSRICHNYMPTEVVDCDHTHSHDEEENKPSDDHGTPHVHDGGVPKWTLARRHDEDEERPLLSRNDSVDHRHILYDTINSSEPGTPSMEQGVRKKHSTITRTITRLVGGEKAFCDEGGPCHGYSDPCGKECFRNIMARGNSRGAWSQSRPGMRRALSTGRNFGTVTEETIMETSFLSSTSRTNSSTGHLIPPHTHSRSISPASDPHLERRTSTARTQHHHHVPKNAFLALSLQTSIAITVHKLPEGFITYATNHANPKLGFSVFMALAIHNITEGFALSLPIYLSTQSRLKAFLYSTVLGGLSQPIGAGIAAIWLNLSEKGAGNWAPTEKVYGCMFAVTAGIMAAVAMSLLQEAFGLGHYKGLCIASVFVGMGLLAASSALTA